MKIIEITRRDVPAIEVSATPRDAAMAMQSGNTGILPVFESGRLVGTLSERSLAVNGYAAGLDPRSQGISRLLDRKPAVCPGEESLHDALLTMREHGVTGLIVTDREQALAGTVSLVELLALLSEWTPEDVDGPELEYVRRVRGGDNGGPLDS